MNSLDFKYNKSIFVMKVRLVWNWLLGIPFVTLPASVLLSFAKLRRASLMKKRGNQRKDQVSCT